MRSQVIIVSFREWISYVVNFFLTYWVIQNISAKDLKPFLIAILGASYLVNLMAVWQKYNGFRFPSVIDGEVSIRLGVPGTFEDSLLLSMYAGFMGILALMGVLRFPRSNTIFLLDIFDYKFNHTKSGTLPKWNIYSSCFIMYVCVF